jgi:hypothetical protein
MKLKKDAEFGLTFVGVHNGGPLLTLLTEFKLSRVGWAEYAGRVAALKD